MTMKISTALQFERATQRMVDLRARVDRTQAQMSTTKQVLSPSDAPDQAAAIQRLRGEVERVDSHWAVLTTALNRYAAEESALKGASDALMRIKELGVQAANDTLSAQDRGAIAAEMQSLRDHLVSLGNSQDDSGNYLFSGTRVSTPAFVQDEGGYVKYQGDQTQTRIPAGSGRTVAYTRAGTDVFASVTREAGQGGGASVPFFDSLDDTIRALRNDDSAGIRSGLDEVDQMLSGVDGALAQTGADQNVAQAQQDLLAQTRLRLKSTLSGIEDLDYTEAATRMKQEMTALQASMTSFGKIAGLSLFDYLR